jgi:glycosyltransferase involved in cell wall biosynthesis
MSKSILYIGNDFASKSKYNSTMETLSQLLRKENFTIYKSSSKKNKFLRLLDMFFSVVYYRNKIDYLLIDTYSTTNFYYAFFTSQIARFFKIKFIPILHGGNLPFRLDSSKYLSKLIFMNSYKNIAPSAYLKYEFELRGYNSVLIPNVILIENYAYKERKKLRPKLLFVRAFADIYNPTMAVKVLYELKKAYPESRLCMIGPDRDGSYKKVKQLAIDLRVVDSIEFTGVMTQKEWHQKSENYDIFINTTNVDNTPVSVIEAMALGLSVVSTDVGGMPYLIKNKFEGLLMEKGNVNRMKEAVIELVEGKYINLSLAARNKVEKFSWSIIKEQWFEILK